MGHRKNLVNKFRTKKSTQSMSESKTVFRPRNALRILGTIAHRARRASCYVRRQHGKRALNFARKFQRRKNLVNKFKPTHSKAVSRTKKPEEFSTKKERVMKEVLLILSMSDEE